MMTSPLLARTLRAGAAGLLAVTLAACSTPRTAADTPGPGVEESAAPSVAAVAAATPPGTAPATPPTASQATPDARWYDLMHVQQTAAPCSSVWNVGSVLPADYQWCADAENNPVAGVRVGPCEVVSYGRTMYAVPGRSIRSVAGSIDHDQAYLTLLTSCKRKPFAAERR